MINAQQRASVSQVGSRNGVIVKDNMVMTNSSVPSGYSSKKNRIHSHSPSYLQSENQQTDHLIPFKIVN